MVLPLGLAYMDMVALLQRLIYATKINLCYKDLFMLQSLIYVIPFSPWPHSL